MLPGMMVRRLIFCMALWLSQKWGPLNSVQTFLMATNSTDNTRGPRYVYSLFQIFWVSDCDLKLSNLALNFWVLKYKELKLGYLPQSFEKKIRIIKSTVRNSLSEICSSEYKAANQFDIVDFSC